MSRDDRIRAEIAEEVIALSKKARKYPPRSEFPWPNITKEEHARIQGITEDAAFMQLKRAVERGEFAMDMAKDTCGHPYCVFWEVIPSPPESPEAPASPRPQPASLG